MATINRENITQIASNTKYMACALYIEEIYDKTNCFFDNCSFRKNLEINYCSNFSFLNCNFRTIKIGYGVKDFDLSGYIEVLRLFEQSISCLKKIQFLNTLELIGSRYSSIKKEQWRNLYQLSQLKELSIKGTGIRNKDFRNLLAQIPSIESLIFKYENINNTGFSGVQSLPKLKKLMFFKSKMRSRWLKYIENLRNLEDLYLGDGITSHGLQYLQSLPKLIKLALPRTKVDNDGLKHLRNLESLQELNLERSMITDEGLRYLVSNTEISELNLSHLAGIGDKGLKYIKHFPRLSILSLRGTKITDNALRYHIKDMSSLKRLDLSETRVSDKGLKYFEHLNHLEYVNICGTEICNIAQLQSILPHTCKIEYLDDDWKIRKVNGLAN